jgi:hypothetical protein
MIDANRGNRLSGAIARLTVLGIATALSISSISAVYAQSNCIRQSLANHDYCGAEGKKIIGNVPDRMIGNFKGACAGHDACYSLGAENVVRAMENRYQMSMLSASSQQKAEFKQEMRTVKRSCDRAFLSDMQRACGRVNLLDRPKCSAAAMAYYAGVSLAAGKAFESALDTAFTCRTR